MSASPLCINGVELSDAHRATLLEWRAELEKLATLQRTSRRARNASLAVHLTSATRGAHGTIAEVCASA